MKAREMDTGNRYVKAGDPKVFMPRFISNTGKLFIVSEPGEEDMQSMWGIDIETEVRLADD